MIFLLETSARIIPVVRLLIALIPFAVVVFIFYRWQLKPVSLFIALARMVLQLGGIGFLLTYIFDANLSWPTILVMLVMVSAAGWIALRTAPRINLTLYMVAIISLFVAGSITLLVVTQGVLQTTPWYNPKELIPLAGMTFANSMNSISLGVDRLASELKHGKSYVDARNIAYKASLIPITNSFLAVGLVSLPGMMTGQILSGVTPLIAIRYQIMIMLLIFGTSGMASALFLSLLRNRLYLVHEAQGEITSDSSV